MEKEPGRLYVVPTPVGNLGDFTFRAIETLKHVTYIYAEDTRTTGVLLKKYAIDTPLRAFHSFNEHKQIEPILEVVKSGNDIALVSDAGTPGISDPGYLLVHHLNESGVEVTCLPGPTALIPALVMSGLPADKFYFEGFLPHKKGRQTRLQAICEMPCTVILYESPFRLMKCIEELIEIAGEERPCCIVREISKIHEQAITASLGTLLHKLKSGKIPAKGEIVLVLGGKPNEKKSRSLNK
ncbi:MAG TPA: 16S rRNA (cytidine(1402)-2'-O)-methyltransferase [Saprospiraceae bacterium]|nr:16S rRNA (cytidine(1402)-2'-O)-methyltransferase [Saprospiraceae bacterium]HQP78145.1 16S rRNA (cytidine(1402)-2'-O)-methyltransferase [Saprospiraceae bacterium]HRN34855.1 16S rRNA (cytidine(1402)-2'-O)-methyltransferase [Saprospiraceae bacterium]HRP84464.1 16S rRNA (cytidine(1402)-2'-O)-methyltransferase [Saprospiraceae bacterium]